MLVDSVPDDLPALPEGLQVKTSDQWQFVSDAERCAWGQVADTHAAFPDADWYILGDDDTFFVPEALQTVLIKYDSEQPWYIGPKSESWWQNFDLGGWLLSTGPQLGDFAFGGGGIIISKGLMQALIPGYEQCLHDHDGMFGGDQRIGACVKVLSPGTDLTENLGMHQVDVFNHDIDMRAILEAHSVQPLISLHHLADVPLPGLGDLKGLRPHVKSNPYGILQQSICQSKQFGTFSITAGLSVRWWNNSTEISLEDLTDAGKRGSLPPVSKSFVYADSLNTLDNMRSKTVSTWYAVYDGFNGDSQTESDFPIKVEVEEPAGPARWAGDTWDRLQCSLVSGNAADNSIRIVLTEQQVADV